MYISLLHSVPSYVPRMGLTAPLWDDLSFMLKGDATCSAVAFSNWQTTSLYLIGSTVHVLTYLYIDTAKEECHVIR